MSRVARKIINYRTSIKHNPLIRYYIDYFRNELNALNPTESEWKIVLEKSDNHVIVTKD